VPRKGAAVISTSKSDPAFVTQFRRQWNGTRVAIKFLSEMSPRELDCLAVEWGMRVLAGLPREIARALDDRERHALALRLGRQRLDRLEARRQRERTERAVI
jgi:hypothetical protein